LYTKQKIVIPKVILKTLILWPLSLANFLRTFCMCWLDMWKMIGRRRHRRLVKLARYLSSIYISGNSTSLINFLHQFSAQVIVVLTGLRNEWREETMYVLHDWWGYGVWTIHTHFNGKKKSKKKVKRLCFQSKHNLNRSRAFMSLRYSTTPLGRRYQGRPKSS